MIAKTASLSIIILSLLLNGTASSNDIDFGTGSLLINGEDYLVEIARSSKQRRHGLMFRQKLDKRHGMLFIFARPGDHRIWMKNTLIPLTVIWIDESETVIDIKKLPPCHADPCPSYGVAKASKYILELDSGNHDLKPGLNIEGLSRLE
jgi:uncharacterized membrane protein (UPF0127 family)